MPLEKKTIPFNFQGGLDTFNDPNALAIGRFTSLINTSFVKSPSSGITTLDKRNGFGQITNSLGTVSFLTTFNKNLISVANYVPLQQVPSAAQSILSYSQSGNLWSNTGAFSAVALSTLSLVKNAYNQTSCDSAVAPNGLICVAYASGDTLTPFKYTVIDSLTGQSVTQPTSITSSGGAQQFAPKVFTLGETFVIAHDVLNPGITAGSVSFLQLLSFPSTSPNSIGSITTVSSNCAFMQLGGPAFDGVVASNTMYLGWQSKPLAGLAVSIGIVKSNFTVSSISTPAGDPARYISLCADTAIGSGPNIYVSYSSGSSMTMKGFGKNLEFLTSPQTVSISAGIGIGNIASSAQAGIMTAYAEVNQFYTYDSAILSHFISTFSLTSQSGVLGETVIKRSVGLASKAQILGSVSFVLASYQSTYQPSYFLLDASGNIHASLAYGNGGGYVTNNTLPSFSVSSQSLTAPYLIKQSITSVNKNTGVGSTTQTAGVFSNLGINAVSFSFGSNNLISSEIGSNLFLNGGFLWGYDGSRPTENNFFVYPDNIEFATLGSSGSIQPDTYFYQAVYEWIDNQANIYRSAPSIPASLVVGSGQCAVSVKVPTLRLTWKSGNNLPTIGVYRWSTSQPVYYKIGTNTVQDASLANSEFVAIIDTKTNAQIIGNEILYTNGGVLENSAAPSAIDITVFDSRLWLINAEDPNLLLFSKPVIENTPVEMTGFQTYFVTPNAGTQIPTGPMTAIAPMDDKLIIFKRNAIYYINGTGPDITGSNNQYSPYPVFINGSIGCIDKRSKVLIPQGLIFQSDNGIWLLGRDLSLKFVGSSVERFNNSKVLASLYAPGTSEVRFHLNTGETLVYDYLMDQWGTSSNTSGLSATTYQNLHTFVSPSNQISQETPGIYYDGTTPVVMSFESGWINPTNLQSYSRAYNLTMLGNFKSGHLSTFGIAYDYNDQLVQSAVINPTNTLGSGSQVEQWQVNFNRQQCQSFKLVFSETSSGTAGAGLTVSGLNLLIGQKKTYPRDIPATNKTS